MTEKQQGDATPTQGHGTLFARFAWVMVGPALWAGVLIFIAKSPGWLTLWELAYVATLGLMIWGRHAEYKSGTGTTLDGEPSTGGNFRSYAVKLLIFSLVCWAAVKVIGSQVRLVLHLTSTRVMS